jgi:hypothetical protein
LVAGKDFHQGALACTIFPENSIDLPGFQRQADLVISLNGTKGFADFLQFYAHWIFDSPVM